MSNYIGANDDDLFDYDPSLETINETKEDFSKTNLDDISSFNLTKDQEQILNQIKEKFSNDSDLIGPEDSKKVFVLNSEIYNSLQAAVSTVVVEGVGKSHFGKAVHICLDELTNGRFSMLNLYHKYELKICRKIGMIAILDKMAVMKDDETIPGMLDVLSQVLKTEFTPLFIKSTFNTTVNILIHSLNVDKVIYRFLAQKLGIEPNEQILNHDLNDPADHIDSYGDTLLIGNYQLSIENEIMYAFFNKETSDTVNLQNMIDEAFSLKSEYANKYRTIE